MKNLITLAVLLLSAAAFPSLRAESASPQTAASPVATEATAPAAASPAAEKRTIQQDGLTFVLLRSARRENVDTEEYFLQDETPDNWSQMVTYQRVELPQPMGADSYVAWLKSQLEDSGGPARLRVVQSGKDASIFGVQYPKDSKADEQFGLALVTVPDARRPNELHLIQYSIQTRRVPVETMELQVKRWRARFQSQAGALSR